MYVCMYICMYVYMYVCMYVYMYVCICVYVCMYLSVCKYVCIYVCMYVCMHVCMYVTYAHSVLTCTLATGWTVRGSNPIGDEIVCACPDRPWGPPNILYSGHRVSFPGVKCRDVVLVTQPHSSAEVVNWSYTPTAPLCLNRLVIVWPLSSTTSKTLSWHEPFKNISWIM
jgi:hypothetical protein